MGNAGFPVARNTKNVPASDVGPQAGPKQRSKPRFSRIPVAAVSVVLVACAIFTSGVMPWDWRTLTIATQGNDTLLTLQDRQVLLKGIPWSGQPLVRSIQVGGWTGSASCPDPTVTIGSPGYVYINYLGRGINRLTVASQTIAFADRGRSVVINGAKVSLPVNQPMVIQVAP